MNHDLHKTRLPAPVLCEQAKEVTPPKAINAAAADNTLSSSSSSQSQSRRPAAKSDSLFHLGRRRLRFSGQNIAAAFATAQ